VQKLTDDGKFVLAFGEEGYESGQFYLPSAIALGPDGLIYVVDSTCRVQSFKDDGTFVGSFGKRGTGEGEFREPTGLAVGPDGVVYVASRSPACVMKFKDGKFVGQWGEQGDGDQQIRVPLQLLFDRNGNLLVGDPGNNRIQVYKPDGTWVRHFGDTGDHDQSLGGCCGMAEDKYGNIYVTDINYISKWSPQGDFIARLNSDITWDLLDDPTGIAIGSDGRVFVADEELHVIQVLLPGSAEEGLEVDGDGGLQE
jgi:DNA-binding beta-propeller fold protein YncE